MGKLCVPDGTGHKEYGFTLNSPSGKSAEAIFNARARSGHVGAKRMADGSLRQTRKFDPTAEEIFVYRQLIGG